jgi:hypothetical protein
MEMSRWTADTEKAMTKLRDVLGVDTDCDHCVISKAIEKIENPPPSPLCIRAHWTDEERTGLDILKISVEEPFVCPSVTMTRAATQIDFFKLQIESLKQQTGHNSLECDKAYNRGLEKVKDIAVKFLIDFHASKDKDLIATIDSWKKKEEKKDNDKPT